MRNNPFLVLVICVFLVLTFNITYFNVKTISSFRTTSANVGIENLIETGQPLLETQTSARAMCLLEQESHRVLYGKNIDLKLPMASTTKIFTALTVLEKCRNVNALIEIDNRAVGIKGTSIYLRKHEKLTVKELLYGMMLPSGNDAATALAYYIGGDVPTFCKLMEESAKNAGAKNSAFKNPHGLDEKGHYTTAYDLAMASAKVMEHPLFKEIVSTKFVKIRGNKEIGDRYLKNKNKLLNNFEGCSGIKTGFTDDAGRCFVGSAKRDNMEVVCSILNCGPMFEECKRLMSLAFNEYKNHEIVPAYNIINTIEVVKGRQAEVKVFSRKSFDYPLTNEEILKINYEYSIPDSLNAPIKKEQKVGTVKVYLEDKLIFQDEVLTTDGVKSSSFFQSLKDFISKW
ncbi:MAG: D-alanyl-D-alanine carboxypeptidase [Clostridia bacterium]|jgi:D-alanyl-D-alanine carboxypeptidase (penicillin-binding protein 5/6)|nr:D-alanyl-D-alanine carboxypeptidase [Clostridia bacterium]MDD3232163.1 D-alanyl-D-alanine carboxypeptidase [Clostridia bacterium]MDD3862763.1 D-alanyl-D-alanine carboxypeptidase [Clostridia bacterium]MDD4408952.1 D-alanyl-D-alanine carboxypeptidase [Clostridia bacterium]